LKGAIASMKSLGRMLIILLMLLSIPLHAGADAIPLKTGTESVPLKANAESIPRQADVGNWNKYLQLTNRFYRLDVQNFNNISCRIEVSQIENQIKPTLELVSKSMQDKVEIKENLADFSLTYSKNGGVSIFYPSLDVKIISEEGMADPVKAKKGLEMMKDGFKQAIDGTATVLKELFEEYETPKISKYKIKEIKEYEKTYVVKYEHDNSNYIETCSNNQCKVKQTNSFGIEGSSVNNYKNIAENKLLLTDAHVTMNSNTVGNMEINMTANYEKVKDVIFPAHYEVHVKQSSQAANLEATLDIYLKNCTLQ